MKKFNVTFSVNDVQQSVEVEAPSKMKAILSATVKNAMNIVAIEVVEADLLKFMLSEMLELRKEMSELERVARLTDECVPKELLKGIEERESFILEEAYELGLYDQLREHEIALSAQL